MRNCLTVDVEDWFHICGLDDAYAPARWDDLPSRVVDNTRDLLDLLDRTHARATFFVLGWIADRYPRLVEEIVRAGHEVGSHGHLHRRVYELTPAEFSDDVDRSVRALAAAGSPRVKGFRAPEWSINDRSLWALDILAARAFEFDSSMAPLWLVGNTEYPQTPHWRRTRTKALLEFPMCIERRLTCNKPLGGGWGLRMEPPARVLRLIDQRNRAGTPVMLHVHPWEIDPAPPRVNLPWRQRFAHYFQLSGFGGRLEDILRGGTFTAMGDVIETLAIQPVSA